MVIGYGVSVPEGSLPVYSVDTEDEARMLIAACCPLSTNGLYVAPELAAHQTLDNLLRFADRLAERAWHLQIGHGKREEAP